MIFFGIFLFYESKTSVKNEQIIIEWVIRSKKMSNLLIFGEQHKAICSWALIFGEWPVQIAHGGSFLVSDLSNLLKSLIFGKQPERFTHIAHQKRGNERIAHFLKLT